MTISFLPQTCSLPPSSSFSYFSPYIRFFILLLSLFPSSDLMAKCLFSFDVLLCSSFLYFNVLRLPLISCSLTFPFTRFSCFLFIQVQSLFLSPHIFICSTTFFASFSPLLISRPALFSYHAIQTIPFQFKFRFSSSSLTFPAVPSHFSLLFLLCSYLT